VAQSTVLGNNMEAAEKEHMLQFGSAQKRK
jgi:hypothetical protein